MERQTELVDEQTHHPKNWMNVRVIANAVIIGLSLGLFGYDNAFIGPLVSLPLFVLKYQGPGVGGLPVFTASSLDLMITIPVVGAALGVFGAVPLQTRLGRKGTFLVAYLFCCIPGSFLQLFAPNLAAMTAGRFWNYLGISVLTNVAPIWLSELMPAHVRGRSVGFAVAGVGIVAILATVVVYETQQIMDSRQYQIPLAIQAAVPCALFLVTFLATESPIWLLSKDRYEDARKNMLLLRNNNIEVTDAELAIQIIALKHNEELRAKRSWTDMLRKENIERTIMAGFATSGGQASGAALLGTFATVLLIEAGIPNAFEVTVILSVVQFVGFCIAPYLYDRIGRRPVALSVYGLMIVLSAVLGALAFTGLTTPSQQQAFAAVTIILQFVNSFTNALGSLMPTEVPTAALREPSMTWTTFWSYVTAVITTFSIPQIIEPGAGNLGAKAFLIFMAFTVVIEIILFFYLPETAQRTLADIDELYASGLPKRNWHKYRCTQGEVAAAQAMEAAHQEQPASA